MVKRLWHSGLASPVILAIAINHPASADSTRPVDTVAKSTLAARITSNTLTTAHRSDDRFFKPAVPVIPSAEETFPTHKTQPTPDKLSDKPVAAPQVLITDAEHPSLEESENQDTTDRDSDDPMAQVTSVSQLSDVQPTDWAIHALQSLVERYGCIAGYPNGTYRGHRALTRYEFAAGLNACLEKVNELLASATSSLVRKEDVTKLQRLQEEFTSELTALRGRVNSLEVSSIKLQEQQFSTTTKLHGSAIFALVGVAAGQNANGQHIDQVTALADRVYLNLNTSFTGRDLLFTRLQALNLNALSGTSTLTPEGDLGFGGETFAADNNNAVGIGTMFYRFPLGRKTIISIEANAAEPEEFVNTVNPFLDDEGTLGALSNFGAHNPIYDLLSGAGIVLNHEFSDQLEVTLGYLGSTPSVSNPGTGQGLFNGPYGAIAQVTIKPSDTLTFGLTYVNSYNADLTAGSRRANLRSYLGSLNETENTNPPGSSVGTAQPGASLAALGGGNLPVSSNSYGIEASWQVNPKFVLSGWAGYTATRTLSNLGGTLNRGDLSIWNWAVTLAFPDFGKEGSVAGVIVGMEPKVTGVTSGLRSQIGKDPSTSLHIEGFYQYQLSDNIFITPGIILLTAPDHNSANASDVIGVIRTTFLF